MLISYVGIPANDCLCRSDIPAGVNEGALDIIQGYPHLLLNGWETTLVDNIEELVQGATNRALNQYSYTEMPVVNSTSVKRYEDYRCITDTTSDAFELISQAEHEPNGLLQVDGYYLVALGQSYGTVGDKFCITLNDGTNEKLVHVMIGDCKAYCDTIDGYTGIDGHTIEGIVNSDILEQDAKQMGDLNYIDDFEGEIVQILKEV